MNKINKVLCLFLSISMLYSCNYADSIRLETIKRFNRAKRFMVHIGFEGQIVEKKYCEKCEITKYTLKIRLSDISKKSGLSKIYFPPYYEFEGDTIVTICVTKDLFSKVYEKQLISKSSDSHYLTLTQIQLLYLSKKDDLWLPE